MSFIPCSLRELEPDLQSLAATTARELNPANHPSHLARGLVTEPQHIALLTSRYWGSAGVKLGVYFLDTQDSGLKNHLLSHMNAWGQYANVSFMETSLTSAQVRVARQRGQGYWSYLGTDILHVPSGQATMNLDSFSQVTPESEYLRVVRHETGHTLGFPHEHLRQELVSRLDPNKTIAYFQRTQGWSAQMVTQQVLTPLDESDLRKTPQADVTSIMTYTLPGSITRDGQPIPGGTDIDTSDGAFAALVYPRAVITNPPPPGDQVTITVPRAGTYRLVS